MAEHDDCTRLHELAPELALGVLTGEERAEARKHLATCPDCREYVLELTSVGDGLLALVPGAEPPVGFEDRLLSKMGITAGQVAVVQASAAPTAPIPVQRPVAPAPIPTAQAQEPVVDLAQRRARRGAMRWVPLAAVAAAIALVFGFGGWAMGLNSQNSPAAAAGPAAASPLLHGQLTSADHRPMGHVWAWAGKPSWLYMDVEVEQHTGMTVTCQVQQADGTIVTVGTFALSNGYGHWGAPAPVSKGEKARLVDSDGTVLASTTLAA
ncbi:MAG TPA: anti-sigma factor [Pseudonocardiaceae bacterium]|jgi:hypothetical protein